MPGSEQVKIYNFCEAATDSYIVTVYMFVCVLWMLSRRQDVAALTNLIKQ